MAIRDIGAAWKTYLKGMTRDERYYIDFRQRVYPPFTSDLGYTLITTENESGSHNLTSGHCDYLLDLTSTITVYAKVKPTFAYNVGTDQPLWSWYFDANNYLTLYYDATSDKYQLKWKDGGTEQTLESAAYVSDITLQVWTELCCTIDLTTGDTTGAALYVAGSAVDTAWSGNIDAKGMNYNLFSLRHEAATEGAYTINQVRVFTSKVATATEVANHFRDLTEEEIAFNLNGEGCGRTRCNITRFVTSMYYSKNVEDPSSGSQGANKLGVTLNSINGEFADDQYAAFDPTSDIFNGNTQKYMQNRCRIEAETWYSGNWEIFFTGRLDESMFSRASGAGVLSKVDISAEDGVSDIARERKRRGRTYEDDKLSDSTAADSLLHQIVRLSTKPDVYNYASNSSFENATITNSWALSDTGAGATWTRESGGLFGSYEGQLVYGNSSCAAYQTILLTGNKKLNVGETYNFSIYLKSADPVSDVDSYLSLAERDSVAANDNTIKAITLSGGEGWTKFEVSHTVTDTDSDRFRIYVWLTDDVTLSLDGAMLVQAETAFDWFVLNDNDGASAIESADDADSDSYDTVGFDTAYVAIVHPWAVVEQNVSIWEYVKEIADASGAQYIGMDSAGTLKFRAILETGYSDPSSIETITSVSGVTSIMEGAQANKIVVRGIKISKTTRDRLVWVATAVDHFTEGTGDFLFEQVTNGSYFPSPTDYGNYFAVYTEESTPVMMSGGGRG